MEYTKDKKFVGQMFDEIAPTYDKLNHVLSGYQDVRWRKDAIKYLKKEKESYPIILDLACGSGDLGIEFLKLKPNRLYSVDLSFEMLKINSEKVKFAQMISIKSEAQRLSFPGNYFDLSGISFGVRNFENLEECLLEINRVMKPGGVFMTMEMFSVKDKGFMQKSFDLYFNSVLPKIGKAVSRNDYAYDYLFKSVSSFVAVDEYTALLEKTGFKIKKVKNNFMGFVYSVFCEKL